ncbi:hypothetical protein PVL29_026546 [Vitis rotundifolia]|uniref:Uncharacterized protein n=1 Tax=Vitis rotundifolia TaxID=103349 RepID=A0AA38YGK1_VITRO|nr:hypothetical protein PVL29_026546 [Vitis rotundifolia]
MMGSDSSADGLRKNRLALADLTNQTGKRGFQFISGNRGVKSGDGYGNIVDYKQGDLEFAKRVCQGVENLMKGKCNNTNCGLNGDDEDLSLLKGKKVCGLRENISSLISNIPKEIKEPSNLLDNSTGIALGGVVIPSDKEVGNASRDSCHSSGSMPTGSEPSESEGYNFGEKCQDDDQIIASDVTQKGPSVGSCGNDGKGAVVDMPNRYGSVDLSRFAESQGSKSFELGRCTGLKNDACSNLNVDANMLKACSCPFCLKAAYIWSDLHYQDIKGRIAALKKSQKEASILVQRSCRAKETDAHGHVNPNKASKLESELMGQWRSLFLSMGDILAHENGQLQSSFLTLKDLRENCKINLELTNRMPSDKQ